MIVRPVLCKPFVGRREELAYLNERRLEAGSSRGGLVLIAGDAGVGKSRLIAEFCTSLARSRWRVGYGLCDASASRPYGPILDVFTRVDADGFELGSAATKREQLDAVVDRFAALAAKRALVVVIEDLHWADAATLDLLAYLGPKLRAMRAFVLASFRPGDLHPLAHADAAVAKIAREARAGRIDLAPFRGVELRTFIDEALAGIALSDGTRRAIAVAGEGNAFFTEELLKSAVEAKSAQGVRPKKRDLPQTIRATLLERLQPFDEHERRIVTQAAVIGRTFGLDLLATTLETEPNLLLPTLRRARDFQLVEEVAPSAFRFRHGLTRDAIYGEFLGAELRPRHRAIAIAMEDVSAQEPALESLAFHWWAAGDDVQAARYNELAGDAAGRIHAHEDAIAFYERALESSSLDASARGAILEKTAGRRVALTWTAEAQATYTAAADLFREAGAHEREAACRVFAAIYAYTIGLVNPTVPLEAMLERIDPSEYLARSRVHLGLAWLSATFWFPSRAAYHLSQVDSRAREEAHDIGLRFHNVWAWVAMSLGDVDRFRQEHAAWVEAARATDSFHALSGAYCNGAMCFSFFGLHWDALSQIDFALKVARAARFPHGEQNALSTAVMCHLMRGDLESARTALEAVPTTSENQTNITFATAYGTLIGAYLDDTGLIERWFDGFEAVVSSAPEIECGAGFAEIMVRRGREREAAAFLHRALPDCELVRGNVFTLLAIARYANRAERTRARDYLARAAAGPTELPERPALALFDAIECQRDARPSEARTLANEAAAGFRRLGIPLLEAAALELAGDAEGALALFRRCGAAYDIRRLNAGSVPRTGSTLNGEMRLLHVTQTAGLLSPREREVAMLAGDGQSNVEIARKLSITHKTVEKHLASVYRKLSISSRAKLGAYVAELRTHENGALSRT